MNLSDIGGFADNPSKKKRKNRKEIYIVLGSCIVAFILGTGIVATLFDKKPRVSIDETLLDDNRNINPVADEPGENSTQEAYHYWYAPENSFGIQETKTVNWSYFKQLFLAHTDWMLEYKRYDYSDWTDGIQYLTIERTWNDTGFWKFNLIFDVPVHVYSARFTFGIDLNCLQYVERDGYEVWVNYSANATETYSVMFNWSDIASIPNLVITKGRTDDMFWFRFRRDNIPAGHYEFDPTFGNTDIIGTTNSVQDTDDIASAFGTASSGGTADSMTIYVSSEVGDGGDMALLLYDASKNFVANGRTESKSMNGYSTEWVTFNFVGTKPAITAQNYYLAIHADAQLGANYTLFGYTTSGGSGYLGDYDNLNHFPNYPATLTQDFWNAIYDVSIYCSYTAPEFSNPSPTNESYNESFLPTVNVTVTHQKGTSSTVDFYTSADGSSWAHQQTNVSILNESVSYVYSGATSYQTTYYWKVTANDGLYNASVVYNFETTPYRTTYFNDTFPNENWIESSEYCTIINNGYVNSTPYFYYNNTISGGLDGTERKINPSGDMYDSTYDYGPSPRVVFTDSNTGYAIGVGTSGSDQPYLYKTTNGGTSWSTISGIDTASDPTDGWAGAVWYDQWTLGDSGTKIHLAFIGDDADDLEYDYIDTSDDSTRGSWNAVHSWSSADGGDGSPAMTKGTNGRLWIGGFGATTGEIYYSDDGDSWTSSKPATLFNDDDDDMQLLPLSDGDIMCIYRDTTATDIGYFIYTSSTSSWSAWTKIADMSAVECSFGASMYQKTGEIYLAFISDDINANGYIKFWIYTPDNSTWWGDITVGNFDVYTYDVGVIVSRGNGDIYVIYSDGVAGSMQIYSRNSTDGGITWGASQQISTTLDNNKWCIGNFMSYYRIYADWANDDLNDWIGTTLRTYTLGSGEVLLNGTVTSKNITKTETSWDKLYVEINNTANSTFSLLAPNDFVIMSGLVGTGDDISSVTNSTVRIKGEFNQSVVMGSWNITWSSGAANTAPTLSGQYPGNTTTDVPLNPTVAVIVTDADAEAMEVTFASNYSGSWVNYQTNSSVPTTTNVTWDTTGKFNTESTEYWWKVYADDGTDNSSEWYSFTTAANVSRTWNPLHNMLCNFSLGNTSIPRTWNPLHGLLANFSMGNTSIPRTWQELPELLCNFSLGNTSIPRTWNPLHGLLCNFSMGNTTIDTTPPSIIINFAGNLSDSGGPYWRPPGESTALAGVWSDGYYTNDSRQSEDWIYINLTVTDGESNVDDVWLNWLNESTWTNYTYAFSEVGAYWEYNTSSNIQTCEGYNYSFNIVANSTGGSNVNWWNKTGLGGTDTRRYVQLNCTSQSISYAPFYHYHADYDALDRNKKDRLHHDQGPDNSYYDTGFLLNDMPTDTVELCKCSSFVGYWFDESICVSDMTLDNLYFHSWWASDTGELSEYPVHDVEHGVYWYKSRNETKYQDEYDGFNTNVSLSASNITYDNGDALYSNSYHLCCNYLDVTDMNFTDNDIYELLIMYWEFSEMTSVISNRSFTSFVLFNVPDNATLNASHADTDSDSLSDWTELYQTYTNPFLSDTDNDGINDYWENQAGSDPNNYTETFNVSVRTWNPLHNMLCNFSLGNTSIPRTWNPLHGLLANFSMGNTSIPRTWQELPELLCNFSLGNTSIPRTWNPLHGLLCNFSLGNTTGIARNWYAIPSILCNFSFGNTSLIKPSASFTMTITGYKIACVSTSTNSEVIDGYRWEIEQNGAIIGTTGWINDSSGHSNVFFLEGGGNFRVNFYIWWAVFDDSATHVGYIYPPAIDVEEPEPEPEIEYKYKDVLKDAKPAVKTWFEDRSPPELVLMGVASLIIFLAILSKRPKKKSYYVIRKKRK